jgi:hypothetical protein
LTVNIAEKEDQMSKMDFENLCQQLGDKLKITKPRIGDIFKVAGVFDQEKIRQGITVKQMKPQICTLV